MLQRNLDDAIIGGVCAGIADRLGTDAVFIRLAFIGAFLFFFAGPLIYLILWAIIKPRGYRR